MIPCSVNSLNLSHIYDTNPFWQVFPILSISYVFYRYFMQERWKRELKIVKETKNQGVEGHFRNFVALFRRWSQLESWRPFNYKNTGKNGTSIRATMKKLCPFEVEKKSKKKAVRPEPNRSWEKRTSLPICHAPDPLLN